VYWPVLRDDVIHAGASLGATLDDLARHASLLGSMARQIEERRQRPESVE
jgi:hypothetical protein